MANGKSGKAVEQVDNRVAIMTLLDRLPEGHRSALAMKVYRATKAFAELLEQHGIKRIDDYVQA
jgi:hypothetical protein